MSKHNNLSKVMKLLWRNWAISQGVVVLVLLLSPLMSKLWLPGVVLVLGYGMMAMVRVNNDSSVPVCLVVQRVTARVLFWSAILMFTIAILNVSGIIGHIPGAGVNNARHPYITSLIVFPVMAVASGTALLRGRDLRFCRECQSRHGYTPGDGSVFDIYGAESTSQLRLLCTLSVIIAIVQWTYYFVFYINVNLNTPDRFYFIIFPVLVYVLSLVYYGMKYYRISEAFEGVNEYMHPDRRKDARTVVRYLVVAGDEMLLEREGDLWDTPARASSDSLSVTPTQAWNDFERLSGLDHFSLKYLFSSVGYTLDVKVIHYAAFIDAEQGNGRMRGERFTLGKLDRMLNSGQLNPTFVSELSRVHTITMAWKTYDRHGRRLYPVKNYRPTFRLRDFKDWDVNYDDPRWLHVATNNEDRAFFRLRKLWRKLVSGER